MRQTSGELSIEQQLKLLQENAPRLVGRGRPRSVSSEFRENGYRDDEGQYQFENGLKPWHERIVEFMIANPAAKNVDIARAFQVSPGWVGQIVQSDAFQEYYNKEMRIHRSRVSEEIIGNVQSMTHKSVEALNKKLNVGAELLPVRDLKEIAKLGLTALGFGGGKINVNINTDEATLNVVGVDPQLLQQARESNARLREANEAKRGARDDSFDPHGYVTSSLELKGSDDAVEDAEILDADES